MLVAGTVMGQSKPYIVLISSSARLPPIAAAISLQNHADANAAIVT
jgi:hypothetical protein